MVFIKFHHRKRILSYRVNKSYFVRTFFIMPPVTLEGKDFSEVDKAVAQLERLGIEYVRFEQPDVHGIAYNKVVPVRHFKRFAVKGLNLCAPLIYMGPNAAIPEGIGAEMGQDGVFAGGGDMFMFPDYATMQKVPWSKENVARVLCSFKSHTDGKWADFPQTREICKGLLDRLKSEHGLDLYSTYELEFQMLKPSGDGNWEPQWKGTNICTNLRHAQHEEFMFKCEKMMHQVGVDFNTMNVEYAEGQFEFTMVPEFGIQGADNAYTFKNGMKEIAQQSGLRATFMTRPGIGAGASNGAHYNHSLWKTNEEGERVNACYDASQPNGVSDVMRHWTAGLLKHSRALCAFGSPTTNCYQRLVPHSWAPSNTTYGIQNRTCMLRWKCDDESRTYMEYRAPSAAVNPYLVIASVIAAGMDGLENPDLELLESCHAQGDGYGKENVAQLPRSLSEAIAALDADDVLKSALGEQFVSLFKMVKQDEIENIDTKFKEDEKALSQAAKDMYLEMI